MQEVIVCRSHWSSNRDGRSSAEIHKKNWQEQNEIEQKCVEQKWQKKNLNTVFSYFNFHSSGHRQLMGQLYRTHTWPHWHRCRCRLPVIANEHHAAASIRSLTLRTMATIRAADKGIALSSQMIYLVDISILFSVLFFLLFYVAHSLHPFRYVYISLNCSGGSVRGVGVHTMRIRWT